MAHPSGSSSTTLSVTLTGGLHTTAVRYTAAPPSTNRRIILAHGAGAGQRHPFVAGLARRLADSGMDVWTFNFPYMEQRRRAPDPTSVLEDCFRRVIQCAEESAGVPATLCVGGKSMGGRIATHLAAQGDRMTGVFALGYPLHPPGKPQQLRSTHLPAITAPVLIVQGERDTFGTPSELTPVIAAMKAPVTLEVVRGGDHALATRGRPLDDLYEWLAGVIANWTLSIGDS